MATVLEQKETSTAQETEPITTITPEKNKRKQSKKQEQTATAPAPTTPTASKPVVPAWLRSPWLLAAATLLAALLVGGFGLVLHPDIIANNINQPYALLAGPALAGSFLAGWLIIKFFAAIEKGIRSACAAFLAARKEDGSAQFFWIVIAVFLAVSVFASGDFFSKLERDALPGLGYATALFIDLVAVQCMRARLNAGRLRDRRGQFLYLLGVLICASASAFANVYTSLSTFSDTTTGALPAWMPSIAPWFGLVFPLLIVLLSMTADYTVDQTSSKLDPEEYKKQEEKRVILLGYQRDMLRDRVTIEREIDELAGKLRGQKERRVFILWAWLFPLQLSGARILEQVEKLYKPQLEALSQQNALLRSDLARLATTAQTAYVGLDQTFQHLTQSLDTQRDTDNRLLVEHIEGLAVPTLVERIEHIEGLAVSSLIKRIEHIEGLTAAVPAEPNYQALAVAVVPLLAPTLDELRKEVRGMVPATAPAPAAPKLDYTKLATALAPLLAGEKEATLNDANTEATERTNEQETGERVSDTEKLASIDLATFSASNGHAEPNTTGAANLGLDPELAALLARPTVSLEETARIIDKDIKYVRTLRSRKVLKHTPRNDDLIKTESIITYLTKSKRPVKA